MKRFKTKKIFGKEFKVLDDASLISSSGSTLIIDLMESEIKIGIIDLNFESISDIKINHFLIKLKIMLNEKGFVLDNVTNNGFHDELSKIINDICLSHNESKKSLHEDNENDEDQEATTFSRIDDMISYLQNIRDLNGNLEVMGKFHNSINSDMILISEYYNEDMDDIVKYLHIR